MLRSVTTWFRRVSCLEHRRPTNAAPAAIAIVSQPIDRPPRDLGVTIMVPDVTGPRVCRLLSLVTMHDVVQFVGFLAAAFGLSVAVWPIFRLRGLWSWLPISICTSVLLTPLVIAPHHVKLRALACFIAVELFFKTTDYAAQLGKSSIEDRRFRSYVRFLVPFPVLLVRFGESQRRSNFNLSNWHRTVSALIGFAASFAVLEALSHVAMVRSSFILDHTLKFLLFTVAIESLGRLLWGVEHAAGYHTRPLIDRAFRARTVGEFWYRYNTRVHAWFDHNIFRRLRGRRGPVAAVWLTFFVSAVLHELGFAIATSRVDGYQLTFFMLQAPAVILFRLCQRVANGSRAGRIALHGAAILWMWATSMFFFHGVNRVFPFFYVSQPWLP